MSTETKSKLHFKGLNGLRGIAALLVLFGHTHYIVFPDGTKYNPFWTFLSQNGGNAVSFFFVLSGFLISYLMLVEIRESQNINVSRFYLKRVFRIWPIYYLIILIVQFIMPTLLSKIGMEWKTVSDQSLVYYLVILPNVPYLFFDSGKLFHLWSIGVEEQFYLIWGPLAKWFRKYFLSLCIGIVIIKFIALKALEASDRSGTSQVIFLLLKQFRIEQMCIGGIGAYALFHHKDKLLSGFLFSKPFQVLTFLILAFFLCSNASCLSSLPMLQSLYNFLFVDMAYTLIPFLYLYLLMNVSVNPKALFGIENRVMDFMGRISYGFYVYHVICIVVAEFALRKSGLSVGTYAYAFLFYSIAIALNTMISYLSYRFFETKIQAWAQRKVLK